MSDVGKLRPYNFEPRKKRRIDHDRRNTSDSVGEENDEGASSSSRCQSSPGDTAAIEGTQPTTSAARDRSDRVGSVSWCTCSNCQPMDRAIECVCCQEISAVENFIEQQEQQGDTVSKCVTLVDDFRMCCLSKTVLEMANVMQRSAQGYTEAPQPQELDNR